MQEGMQEEYIAELRGICKRFPGVNALQDINIAIKSGEIHAIVGENGAGKSTLIKVMSGVYRPDEGRLFFEGKPVKYNSPQEAIEKGISVVHQELQLIPTLSIAENIFLGRPLGAAGIVNWRDMYKKAQALVDSLGVELNAQILVSELSVAQKQIVEICRSISRQSKLIIMDEPSATLTDKELNVLFRILQNLIQQGVAIVYISHRLDEVFQLAATVTILRDGMHVGTLATSQVTRDKMISMMVGRELRTEYPKEDCEIGEVILRAEKINRKGVLHDISFELRQSEILGIAGLVGSGRTELARAVLGIDPIEAGAVYLHGEKQNFRSFRASVKKGLAFVPEERRTQGIIPGMKIKENISLVGIEKLTRFLKINRKEEKRAAEEYVQMLSIAAPGINTVIQNLSGGNQQKVVIAKWLYVAPKIIILDEPTRGIDVAAKAEIYFILNGLVKQGMSIIMISSEIPELIGMADRVLVMHDGEIKGSFNRKEVTQEKIMELCVS